MVIACSKDTEYAYAIRILFLKSTRRLAQCVVWELGVGGRYLG